VSGRPIREPDIPRRRGKPEISWPAAKKPAPDRSAIRSLQERAKELDCLYRVDEALSQKEAPLKDVFAAVLAAIPPGWQYPAACQARITWEDKTFATPGYAETVWRQTAPLKRDGVPVGQIEVSYTAEMAEADIGPFLKEEARLINAIAERITSFLREKDIADGPDSDRG